MKTWITKSGYTITQLLTTRSRVFLLSNNKINILIDTSPQSQWNSLNRRLQKLQISHIDYLILTHTHYDHAASSAIIKEKYGAKIIVHFEEIYYLERGENIIPKGTNFFSKILVKFFSEPFFDKMKYPQVKYDIPVYLHYDFVPLGFDAYILHTPGHTPGSISVIVDDEIAIVGDAMFGVFPWSVFPPFANNIPQMIESWEKLLATKCHTFLPAHGSGNDRKLLMKEYLKKIKKMQN
jgi:glyoxylase-like metal-dependent hydrolase (beta-lactamase superfamily II)